MLKDKRLNKSLKETNKCIIELIHFVGCYLEIECDLKTKDHTNYIKSKYKKEV